MNLVGSSIAISINHEDREPIVFSTKPYGQTKYRSNAAVIFKEVNAYLQTLPLGQRTAIYESYSTIHKLIYEARAHTKELRAALQQEVKALIAYVDIDQLDMWLRFPGRMPLSSTAVDRLSDDLEERRTFLAEDYRNLTSFTIACRFMLPIWGEYQDLVASVSKNAAKSKEHEAIQLITESKLYMHPSVQRILIYIDATVDAVGGSNSALVAAYGSDMLLEHLLAASIVRRLAVADIYESLDRGGLTKNIHGYIQSALKDFDSQQSRVRIPGATGGDSDTGEDFSRIEALRTKPEKSPGTTEKYKVWLDIRGPAEVARTLDPTVPDEFIASAIQTNHELIYVDLTSTQLVLAKWIMHEIMPPNAIDNINRQQISTIIFPAVQAVLMHWGFADLAILLTAQKSDELTAMTPMSYQRITKNTHALLEQMFPYQIVSKASINNRQSNVGYVNIETIANEFIQHQWNVNIPPIVAHTFPALRSRSLIVAPSDISERLAQLVIKIWNIYEQHESK